MKSVGVALRREEVVEVTDGGLEIGEGLGGDGESALGLFGEEVRQDVGEDLELLCGRELIEPGAEVGGNLADEGGEKAFEIKVGVGALRGYEVRVGRRGGLFWARGILAGDGRRFLLS